MKELLQANPEIIHGAILLLFFVSHVAIVRHFARTETAIFKVQFSVFVLGPLVTLIVVWKLGLIPSFEMILAFYGLSAIYAITFLELWSLTESSYSLQMLVMLTKGAREIRNASEEIGESKHAQRIMSLVRLGLISPHVAGFQISRLGRVVATGATAIANLAGVRYRE